MSVAAPSSSSESSSSSDVRQPAIASLRRRQAAFSVRELSADGDEATAPQTTDTLADADTDRASAAFATAADIAASSAAPGGLSASPAAAVTMARRPRPAEEEASSFEYALLFLFCAMLVGGVAVYLSSRLSGDSHRLFGPDHGRKMQDTHTHILVDLEAVYAGHTVQSSYPGGRQVVCPHCSGHGGASPHDVSECSVCDGSGVRRLRRQIMPGFFQDFQQTCPSCHGRGRHIHHACHVCRGDGVLRDMAPLRVPLPVGAPEGWTVRLLRGGDQPHVRDADAGVAPGDVLVQVRTRPHARFHRRGVHLHYRHVLSLRESLLGFRHTVDLLGGVVVELARDEITPAGQVMRVAGAGMPAFDAVAARDAEEDAADHSAGASGWHGAMRAAMRPLLYAAHTLLPAASSRHFNSSTPRGDLFVEFVVEHPKGHTFTPLEKAELNRLLESET